MATSNRNSHAIHLAAICATGLLGVAEAAPAPCANQEIVLEAKSLEMDYRNNNAVLRDVVITQCDVRIQAAEARVSGGLNFENSKWTISGDVRINAAGRQPEFRQGDRLVLATNSFRAPPSPVRPPSSNSNATTAPPRAAMPTPSTTKPPAAR